MSHKKVFHLSRSGHNDWSKNKYEFTYSCVNIQNRLNQYNYYMNPQIIALLYNRLIYLILPFSGLAKIASRLLINMQSHGSATSHTERNELPFQSLHVYTGKLVLSKSRPTV